MGETDRPKTIECPRTGEQIPAVLVARWSERLGLVSCSHCQAWHEIEIINPRADNRAAETGGGDG